MAGILVFALPLLVSCRLDQLLSPGKFAGLKIQPDTVGVADTVRLRVNMTAPLRFISTDTTLATVDQNGVVTGRKRGKAAITATVTGVPGVDRPASTTDTVWVVAVSVTLAKQLDTLTSVDDTTCLKTAAFDKLGDTLTAATPTITKTSDPDNTLTAFGAPGCYRATTSGRTATFVAQLDTAHAQVTLTVHQIVNTVQLAQHNIRMRSLAETTTIAADARDARGNPVPATLLTWGSTDALVASVDTVGHVTATQRNGQTKVFASNSGKADTALVTVRQDAHTATIAPSPATIQTVSGVDTVRATAKDSLGQPIPDSLVVFDWVSDSTTIATARTLATGRGVLQAQQEGRARIRVSAAAGDRAAADTDSVTVQFRYGSITVTPNNDTLTSLGDTTRLTAVVRDTAGTVVPQAQVSWQSGNAAVSVDTGGHAVAHSPTGSPVTITATSRTATGTAAVLVKQLAARLVPVPSTLRLTSLGQSAALSDSAFDARDSLINPHATAWVSADPAIAQLTGTTVTARANGSTRIRGALNAAAESVTVDVVQAAASVVVTPPHDTLRTATAQVTLRAKVKDANDSTIANPGLVWQSLTPSVAQILSAGGDTARIGAVAEGTTLVDARSGAGGGSANGTVPVVVRYKLNTLTVAPTNPKFNHLGDTLTFTASGQDSVGNTITNPQVIWISRTPSRLTINPTTGLATAVDTGDVWVVATHDNARDSTLAQVRPPVLIADQTLFFADSLRLGTGQADTTYRHISNAGTFTLGAKARIAHSAAWLTILPDTVNLAATALDSIRLIASATGLAEGLYTDTVVVTSIGAKNSPARIPVSLRVVCPTAAVAADTSIAGSFAPGDCRSPQRARSFADLYRFTGNVSDTVNIFLTTGAQTDLDTYLYLLDASGAVIASNDDCPGLGRNSCITQFPLPATAQYRIEATTFDSAQFTYTVTLTHPVAPTAATALAQRTTGGAAIAAHDSVNNTTVVLAVTGHDGNAHDTLRLQVEVRPIPAGFAGTPTDTGSAVPNATLGVPLSVTVPNLQTGTWYRWRARVADQTGRVGPWTQFSPDSALKVVISGPVLTVTPGSVNDTALATGSSVTTILSVANTGSPSFTWSPSKVLGSTWLSLSPSTPGQPQNTSLTLTLSPTGLSAGTYTDTVLVNAGAITGSPVKIPVTFIVQQPVLVVAPTSVAHSANAGSSTIFVDTLKISNPGTGSLTWTATKDSAWLHLSKTSGGAPDQIIDTVLVAGRPAGTYKDTVRISSPQTGTTVKVPVILTLQQPLLVVTPSSVTDSANVGSSGTPTDTIHIANGDGGTLGWTAVRRPIQPWLTISAASGTAPSDLVVTLNPTGLSTGTLTDTVVVSSADANDSAKILVTFNVRQPVLSVTPTSLLDSAQQGTGSKIRTLSVTNPGGGVLSWSTLTDTTWLSAAPSTGTGAGTITVTLNPAGLAAGTHTGHVTVTSAGATGSPAQITVTFVITPPPFLSVSPSARTDHAFVGSTAPKTSSIIVSNTGGGSLTWSAAMDTTWIGLSPTTGTAPATDTTALSLSPVNLAVGTHTGHVVFTAAGAQGSPDTVTTALVIDPCAVHPLTPDTLDSGSLTTSDCGAPHRAGSFARVYSVNASTSDTLDVKLTATFDAYLVVTDGAGGVLATNDTCPGLSGTACVRNVVVPASGIRIEATTAVAGATGSFSLFVTKPLQPGGPGGLGQFMANGSTAIGNGGTDTTSSVVFKGNVTDPNTRDTLRLQVELRFAHVANFTGVATDSSAPVLPGATATVTHTGLADDTVYHWKARTCDQTGRCSAWADFGPPPDSTTDFHVAVPQSPNVPTDTMQTYQSPGGAIALGGPDTTGTIVFKATVSDPDPGDTLQVQVERQPAGAAFTGLPNLPNGTAVFGGMVSTLTLSGQPDSANYRWQVRTIDQKGLTSGWVDFGGNGVAADYKIDLPKPPDLPTGLGQFNGVNPIGVGGGTGGGLGSTQTVTFKATVTDPNIGDSIAIEVEVKATTAAFDGTGLTRGTGVPTNGTASVSASYSVGVLASNYHWRARACDRTNRCSQWVPFGGNSDVVTLIPPVSAATDFHVP